MNIKERITQTLELKKITKEAFFEKVGVTSANFRGKAKKTPLNSTVIENILSEIPDLSAEWLLTGNGEMFKNQADNNPSYSALLETNKNLSETVKNLSEAVKHLSSKRDVVGCADAEKSELAG